MVCFRACRSILWIWEISMVFLVLDAQEQGTYSQRSDELTQVKRTPSVDRPHVHWSHTQPTEVLPLTQPDCWTGTHQHNPTTRFNSSNPTPTLDHSQTTQIPFPITVEQLPLITYRWANKSGTRGAIPHVIASSSPHMSTVFRVKLRSNIIPSKLLYVIL